VTTLEQAATAVGAIVATISIVKAGFAAATFFAELSSSIKALTEAVRVLTERLDDHNTEVRNLRSRVEALEYWREAA
jgi:hypothetical protein